MIELHLLRKDSKFFRLIYLKLFDFEIISMYSYGKHKMLGVQLFNKKIL